MGLLNNTLEKQKKGASKSSVKSKEKSMPDNQVGEFYLQIFYPLKEEERFDNLHY